MTLISRLRQALLGDPIRIAPEEGRLLRLQVGQRVILDDALFVVAERDESQREGVKGVRYRLVEFLGEFDETDRRHCLPDAPYLIESHSLATGCGVKLERDSEGSCIWLDCRLPSRSE